LRGDPATHRDVDVAAALRTPHLNEIAAANEQRGPRGHAVAHGDRHLTPGDRDDTRAIAAEGERQTDDLDAGVVSRVSDERLRGAECKWIRRPRGGHAVEHMGVPAAILHGGSETGVLDADHRGTKRT